jgi:hypothetical protein
MNRFERNGDVTTTASLTGFQSLNLSTQFSWWNYFPSNVIRIP